MTSHTTICFHGELLSPDPQLSPNSYVEPLTLNVTIFGDGDFKEVIKVK